MTITIKEKITEALENYRDAAEPLELFRALGLNDKDQFAAAVQELEQEGVLVATKKGRLLSVKSAGLTPAQMISQSKGFSFARPLEGGEDIYVAQEDRKRAMLGDTVLLRDIRDSGKGLSGKVEKIIRKGNRLFTGTVVRRGRDLELELDGAFRYQVPVEKKGSLHGKNGDKVQAILSYGPRSGKLTARILKVYGKAASAKVCADAIIDANGIPKKFKKETLREAEKLSREPITPAERKKARRPAGTADIHHRWRRRQGFGRRDFSREGRRRLEAGRPYCGCIPLCKGRIPGGRGSEAAGDLGVFCRPGNPHAAGGFIQRLLLVKRWGGKAGLFLLHDAG